MPLKAIVDIDVNDEEFKSFAELFDKFQHQLDRMPGAWKATDKITKSSFESVAAALLAQNELSRRQAVATKDAAVGARDMERSWANMARSTKSVAGNIEHATKSLLRWSALTGLITGLLGGGGLFGLDRLAADVSATTRQAQGLGVTYGEQRAFGVDLARLVDPGTFLGGVNEALRDVSKRWALIGALGPNTERLIAGKDTAQVSALLLPAIKGILDRTSESQLAQVIQARGFGQFGIDVQTAERLKATPASQLREFLSRYQQDRKTLGLESGTQKAWQDFTVQMSRAGQTIENVFVNGLTGLTKPLSDLSAALTDVLKSFFANPQLKVWMEEAAAGIETFAKYVGTPAFSEKVKSFVDSFAYLADKIGGIAKKAGFVENLTKKAPSIAERSIAGFLLAGPPGALAGAASTVLTPQQWIDLGNKNAAANPFYGNLGKWWNDLSFRKLFSTNAPYLGLIRKLEGSGDRAVSPTGAIGRYQIEPGTARQYGYDPARLMDPAYNETVADSIVSDLRKRYHDDLAEILVAYNAGPGRADEFARAGDNPNVLPAETRNYLAHALALQAGQRPGGVVVRIENNTGGNAVVSAAQVAH